MAYEPEDLVRVIAVKPGSMIESYLGYEGRVIGKHLEHPLYEIELDVGRANVDRAGQLGPRFIVREDQLDPDVTEKMIEAARAPFADDPNHLLTEDFDVVVTKVYRAMRAARFER